MTTHSFVFPTIVSLPCGYDATIVPPIDQIAGRLQGRSANIVISATHHRDGVATPIASNTIRFENGALAEETPPAPLVVPDPLDAGGTSPAYLEIETRSEDDTPVFSTKAVFGLYTIFGKDGKASFFSDNAYKYGAPPVISQVARFKKYVDAYPVIHIDRAQGIGQSLTLINPYKRPILATVQTEDGRKLKRCRVMPQSVITIDLSELLHDDETAWMGQIQLTANNRVITFNFKHRFGDPTEIWDYEHLDPFREDPTHLPWTQRLRQQVGDWLQEKRGR